MISLPLITPRDSHELWFGSSQPYRPLSSAHNPETAAGTNQRRNGSTTGANFRSSPLMQNVNQSINTLSTLQVEERALRARKNNIASFGCSWIRPAGCPKTMLGMKEEEAEREEALAAADAELAAAAVASGETGMEGDEEEEETGMERDLDDDIPDADEGEGDASIDGLVEEGEEGLEEEEGDSEAYMERDLDDEIPEAFVEDDDDNEDEMLEDFDNQVDLDDEIPSAVEEMTEEEEDDDDEEEEEDEEEEDEEEGEDDPEDENMGRNLDDDIPEAEESQLIDEDEEEWQHTDTDAEFDDEDDEVSFSHDPFSQNLRASTASATSARSTHGLPLPPRRLHPRETEAQRRFLQRWSGGGDALDTSSMMVDEEDLRASLASQASQTSQASERNVFGRFPRRRSARPRDSFD